MHFKNNIKQRNKTVQGLRSLKDTLPTNIKKIIKKRGHMFSETLNNWKYIVGVDLFKVCYPKSFKNSNKFNKSMLVIMVKRGHEVDLEYSKKQIINKINTYFGYSIVEKLKLVSFDNYSTKLKENTSIKSEKKNKTNNKQINKIIDIKNEKIKKSLIELNKIFKKR